MKKLTTFFLVVFLAMCGLSLYADVQTVDEQLAGVELPNFVTSPYFDEQVLAYTYNPDIRIEINAPAAADFDAGKPVALVFYALPNGISTDWAIGKQLAESDNSNYTTQHIGAQARFIRAQAPAYNLVTVYLETSQQDWNTWRTSTTNADNIIKQCTESILQLFEDYNPYIVLSGHGAGGNYVFGFIDAAAEIPAYVKRISFIDSNYEWDNSRHGQKLATWLAASTDNYLSVICYNDSVALSGGQPVVSATEGTWHCARMMKNQLKTNLPYAWTETGEGDENAEFVTYTADNSRIQFLLKTNPSKTVLHTTLVEKNGYIQAILSGTDKENVNYTFWGDKAYETHIQEAKVYPHILRIPPRKKDAVGGAAFMTSIASMSLTNRENAIYNEIAAGNIPNSFRKINRITKTMKDAGGTNCVVELEISPDFLAIGSDDDFCRIPMLPTTAQKIATLFGATLPTSKMSDLAWEYAAVKLSPQTMNPDASMTTVPVFAAHNTLVETSRKAVGKPLSAPIAGHKKDIIISNRIAQDRTKLYIYGWHYTSGTPIQSISGAHDVNYVDYSHGVRMINQEMLVDGKLTKVRDILRNTTKYALLSNETGTMSQTEYTIDPSKLPAAVKSFAVVPESTTTVKVLLTPAADMDYTVFYGTNISNLDKSFTYNAANPVIGGLTEDALYYFAVEASNSNGSSPVSKKLAATPTAKSEFALVVEGFNRIVGGNNGAFVKQHAEALHELGKPVASAGNDAVIAGLVDIENYPFVDWILGEESTADRTFDLTEQNIVKKYLESGGFLYVSGAEIGWDIARPASVNAAVQFTSNYLKFTFTADNPGAAKGLSHKAEIISDTGFGTGAFNFNFADGTTTAVEYPDVIAPTGGSTGFLRYILDSGGATVNYAGVAYAGKFGSSSLDGKVIVTGIPFESIVPAAKRTEFMSLILAYDGINTSISLTEINRHIHTTPVGVKIEISEPAVIAIYSVNGQLLVTEKISETTEYTLKQGAYLIKINEAAVKFVK